MFSFKSSPRYEKHHLSEKQTNSHKRCYLLEKKKGIEHEGLPVYLKEYMLILLPMIALGLIFSKSFM